MSKGLRVIGIIIVCVLLFVKLPALVLEIILGLEMASIAALLILTFSKRRLKFFFGLLLFLTLFSIATDIAFSRNSLAGLIEEDYIPFVMFLSDIICRGNFVNGIVASAVLPFGLAYFVKHTACASSEIAARFALDVMSQKNYCVDTKLKDGKITQQEADAERKMLRDEADCYSALNGFAKFLFGTIKTISFLCVILFAAAIAIQILQNSKTYMQAVEASARIVSGCVWLFSVPVALISLCLWMVVRHNQPFAA